MILNRILVLMRALILLMMGLAAATATVNVAFAETETPTNFQLSLSDAVQRALQTSPKVRAAAAELESQVDRRRSAWADVGPRVKAEYNQARFEDAQTVNFGGQEITMRPEETKTGSLTVVQPITGAVALVERARLEGTQEDMKAWSYQIAKAEVGFMTVDMWLKAYQAKRQHEIAVASVAAAESQLRDAAALERAGRMNRGDVLKLELAVSEAKARAAQASAQEEVVYAALKEAVGLTPGVMVTLAGSLPDVPETEPTLGDALREAMERRLEPKLAAGGVVAANFGKKLAYTNFSPSINAFAKWDKTFGEPAGFGASDDVVRMVGIQATWDIWNNGAHVFAVREASANVVKAEESAKGVEAQIRLDVQTALAQLAAARESLALAKVAVSQAEEAYRIEKVRFQSGARSATDLILAETSNGGAQGRLVAAQTDVINWYMKLRKALGDQEPKSLN